MKMSTRGAVFGGLLGLLIMFGIWLLGHRTPLWLLVLWPSQFVGMGFDGVNWPVDVVTQMLLYGLAGWAIGLCLRVRRGEG